MQKGPIELTYRIYECSAKKLKLEPECHESTQANNNNNNNWKEVQLRISETGEMSITGIQDAALGPSILEIVNSDQQKYKNEVVTVVESNTPPRSTPLKKELPGLKYIGKSANVPTSNVVVTPAKSVNSDVKLNDVSVGSGNPSGCAPKDSLRLETCKVEVVASGTPNFLSGCATLSSGTTTMVFSTINSTKCSTKSEDSVSRSESVKPDMAAVKSEKDATSDKEVPKGETVKAPAVVNNVTDKNLKRKSDSVTEAEPPAKLPKPTILNHSLGLLNLSNNHPLKKHSKLNRNGESIKEIVLR